LKLKFLCVFCDTIEEARNILEFYNYVSSIIAYDTTSHHIFFISIVFRVWAPIGSNQTV